MKGTTIYFKTREFWDLMFALNSMISHYEQWEQNTLELDPKDESILIYIRENLKIFKSLKNKIKTKVKSVL